MAWLQKFFMFMLCALNVQKGQKCTLHSRIHFGEPLPIIIRNGRLLEPTDNVGNVELDFGETMTLSCEGAGYISHPNSIREMETATIACDGAEVFKNEEWLAFPSQFTGFHCSFPPNYTSRRTNRTCFAGNRVIEVGYKIREQYYPLYESCFDENNYRAIYSKYTQKPYNAHYQTKVDRPFFITGDVFGFIPLDTLFSHNGQRSKISQLVGTVIDRYVSRKDFLSRGHLAAKTDFVFAFGERATFHYINCAPQWVGFNGGNWNTLEIDLRNHIYLSGYNTIVYTGTYGVSSLLNDFGRRVEMYLYTDENNNPVIPVPQYFYKVVYEPSSKRGVVFIGINNPYYSLTEAKSLFFCQDICRNNTMFAWLTWRPDDPRAGFTFCCTVPSFIETVKHLPADVEVESLLT